MGILPYVFKQSISSTSLFPVIVQLACFILFGQIPRGKHLGIATASLNAFLYAGPFFNNLLIMGTKAHAPLPDCHINNTLILFIPSCQDMRTW